MLYISSLNLKLNFVLRARFDNPNTKQISNEFWPQSIRIPISSTISMQHTIRKRYTKTQSNCTLIKMPDDNPAFCFEPLSCFGNRFGIHVTIALREHTSIYKPIHKLLEILQLGQPNNKQIITLVAPAWCSYIESLVNCEIFPQFHSVLYRCDIWWKIRSEVSNQL